MDLNDGLEGISGKTPSVPKSPITSNQSHQSPHVPKAPLSSDQCGRSCCKNIKTKTCSACMIEGYCGAECQHKDWKIHKKLCPYMKNSDNLLSLPEIHETIMELKKSAALRKGTDSEIRILEYCLSFVEYQLGDRTEHKMRSLEYGFSCAENQHDDQIAHEPYRKIEDSSNNWFANMLIFYDLCNDLGEACILFTKVMKTTTLDNIHEYAWSKKALYYFEKSLSILNPWRIQLDLEESERISSLDEEKINTIYCLLSEITLHIADVHITIGLQDFKKAEDYSDMAISYARSYAKRVVTGVKRIDLLYDAIFNKGDSLFFQLKHREGKVEFEESYNVVAEAYSLDHPLVLKSAQRLILIRIELEEYYDAERYSRVVYQILTRPVDTESDDIACAAESLAKVTFKLIVQNGPNSGDIVEAEMLVRKALRIKENNEGHNNFMTASTLQLLSDILQLKGNHNQEVKDLLKRLLAIRKAH